MTGKTIAVACSILVGAALAGCATEPTEASRNLDVPTVSYACEDGTHLAVWFEPDQAIITENDGETLFLPQQRAASGMWYKSDRMDLRGKGEAATWTSGERTPTNCQVVKPGVST